MTRTRKLGLIAGVGVLLLALTGCGAPESGRIADKRHSEGYYYTTYYCAMYNKDGGCQLQMPQQNYSPPSWGFDLYASEDEHGWRSVSENTYESYEVGDWYDPAGKGSF